MTITELAERSGVTAATLRMWEARHGFPQPERSRRGHRRYAASEVDRVRRVHQDRQAGMSLTLAIRRVTETEAPSDASVFAELRQLHPELEPRVLSKPAMNALSQAIEEECLARAERPLLYAAFQRQRFYRQVEHRWRELARTAHASFVFADFNRVRHPRAQPVELPLRASSPMIREWLVVCWDARYATALVAWEHPQRGSGEEGRRFEAVWSLEPEVVRHAASVCTRRVGFLAPRLAAGVGERVAWITDPSATDQLRAAAVLTGRMAAHLSSS